MEWIKIAKTDLKLLEKIAKKHKITELQAQLLINRGIISDDDINMYLNGKYEDLYNPFDLKDVDKAVHIITESVSLNEKICVFGDFDADGITATSIMLNSLKNIGADIMHYLPSRTKEGYGMNIDAIDKIFAEGVKLLITVDNGIVAKNEVAHAKKLGMKVIVTDHHSLQEGFFPEDADAVVNPKQEDCNNKNKDLCGGAIAWKLMYAYYEKNKLDMNFIKKQLALAAIATVADIMPLTGENRIIVKEGLKQANEGVNVGLSELIKAHNIEELTSEDIGFRIGPCLNADGRLGDANTAIALLTTAENSAEYAEALMDKNASRKHLTSLSCDAAQKYILDNNLEKSKFMVVFDEDIPEGLVGLVASRIKEKYNVPTLVFTKGENCFKASGRGVEGYPINMYEALMATKDLWIKGGGHAMACGVSIEPSLDKLKELSKRLNSLAEEALKKEPFKPKKSYDMDIIEPSEDIAQEILILEPTGKDNPKAKFVTGSLSLAEFKTVGDGSHITLQFDNGLRGICFGGTHKFQELNTTKLKLLYSLIIDVWAIQTPGGTIKKRTLKMMIEDMQSDEIKSREFLISSIRGFKK